MVRSNNAGSHSEKYLRGGPGTVHLVRADGGPGNSKRSPPAGDSFHGGRSTLAGLAGAPCSSAAANADAVSTAPENTRREIFFIEPPARLYRMPPRRSDGTRIPERPHPPHLSPDCIVCGRRRPGWVRRRPLRCAGSVQSDDLRTILREFPPPGLTNSPAGLARHPGAGGIRPRYPPIFERLDAGPVIAFRQIGPRFRRNRRRPPRHGWLDRIRA